jgi:ribose/xylose/arabinose/galactoside ABC-type transport system permease subunit
MTQALFARVERNRKFLPVAATISLFLVAYALGALAFSGMADGQAFLNLFDTTPFLLICVVGETFVILSGGIDLSVSGVLALTTVVAASLIVAGWNAWVVMPLMLVMGMTFGLVMGLLITYLKVQPFIATLAGMWLARGMCYMISDSEVRIYDPVYRLLAGTKILIPGLSDPSTKRGDYITVSVVVAVAVLAIGLFVAHYTRFGRTVYAIGGNNGANEQSARLMGLPVNRTKVLVYVLNGFCSALAGIAYSIYVGSGHGTHATGFELTVIAAVVIGGTALQGGQGYLIGSLFGVLITALIQSLIQFNGQLSSWWTSIVIGALMLLFLGVQSLLAAWNDRDLGRQRSGMRVKRSGSAGRGKWWRNKKVLRSGGVLALVVVGVLVVATALGAIGGNKGGGTTAACQMKGFRQDQAGKLMSGGAVIAFERNGGTGCIDELYAIYADGKIVSDYGDKTVNSQIPAADVATLLTQIDGYGWFTDNFYSTSHTPCGACFTYYISVSYNGKTKTVEAVDGGTDAPSNYWPLTGRLSAILYPTSH